MHQSKMVSLSSSKLLQNLISAIALLVNFSIRSFIDYRSVFLSNYAFFVAGLSKTDWSFIESLEFSWQIVSSILTSSSFWLICSYPPSAHALPFDFYLSLNWRESFSFWTGALAYMKPLDCLSLLFPFFLSNSLLLGPLTSNIRLF